ncbi:MAG: hypothetical protein HQL72_12145 [Magnetococcales bacterium]|nr:hypothetical protein [Magnetococcales bacterium]
MLQAILRSKRFMALPLMVAMIFFTLPYQWANAEMIDTDALLMQEQGASSKQI